MTETLSRDELHDRINKANFDPADVVVVGYMDTRPPAPPSADALFGLPADMYDKIVESFREQRARWIADNVRLFGREFPGSRCEHCGNSIRWAAIVQYVPTGQHFVVGEVCADERMSLASRADHDLRLVKMAAEHRAELARRAEARATFYREHPAEAAYLFDETRDYNSFMDDLARKLDTYGALSEKQLACVTRDVERIAKVAQVKVERAEALVDAPALAEGRYEIEGTVVAIKSVPDYYGTGSTQKIVVELADGNRVYGTVPSALYDQVAKVGEDFAYGRRDDNPFADGLKGQRVRFTGTVERSDDDEHFGFYKRPTKATIVTS